MPTKPISDLLQRKRRAESQNALDTLADSLEEVVNFGTHVFVWHAEANAGKSDEVVPVALFFRHFLEMIDAVSVLIRHSSIDPSKTCLRSAFEATVQLKWIMDSESSKRGMAFMTWHVHQRLKLYRRHDLNTQQGKQLSSQLKGSAFENIDATDIFDLEGARSNLRSLLSKPLYQECETEYQQLRDSGERNPQWYRFFGGPRNLEQLATEVGMPAWYQILYREWSGTTHATDVLTGKIRGDENESQIMQMRAPAGAKRVFFFSVTLALQTYRSLMKTSDPSKLRNIRTWYETEVMPLYRGVVSKPGNPTTSR